MEAHDTAVAVIAARLRQFYDRREPFRIYHGSTNSTRTLSLRRDKIVDTSRLSKVLKVDTQKWTALVEPNVSMDDLVNATLQYGLVPPVVMEYPGITVGGGYACTSGESSSFRHGFFDQTINWTEMVLANGNIVKVSSTDTPDLFFGAATSLGTLGVTTLLELRLIEAKSYVEVTYFPVSSISQSIQKIGEETVDPSNDYVDGILFAIDRGVVISGRLINAPTKGTRIQSFSRGRDPWFYLHAQKVCNTCSEIRKEAIPIRDYLFRYDRGGFWVGTHAFHYFMTPFNRITRWVLNPLMKTRVLYHALHESGHGQRYIIQDLTVSHSMAQNLVEFVDETFGIYPLWLCPMQQGAEASFNPHTSSIATGNEMLLNVGLWGAGPKTHDQFVDANRKLERKMQDLSGMKWLYAHTYYTEEEFWSIYNRSWYDGLRAKYDATTLPSVYDKVKINIDAQRKASSGVWAIWPLSGLYGALQATVGRNYLLAEDRHTFRAISFLTVLISLVVALVYRAISAFDIQSIPFRRTKIQLTEGKGAGVGAKG